MTVQCIACKHFSFHGATGLAAQGYGHCEFATSAATFESATFMRTCQMFERADFKTVQDRETWLAKKQAAFKKEVTGS